MRCRTFISTIALAALLALGGFFTALAQEEPQDAAKAGPVDITVPPAPALAEKEDAPVAITAEDTVVDTEKSATPGVSGRKAERRIEQRVDGLNPVKLVKPERKTPKNVMRIDNQKKRKVQPVAVIKAPLAPWGYSNRYIAGDIARPENPYQVPGAQGAGQGQYGNLGGGLLGGRGGQRDRYDEDEDY
ncbi:MAG: hypothetical protein IT365_14330 [Candidatus Hydrogenedentes bacterium]|nr:hypothetical protein [Candidatus Hydrogenedentota bacterium]